MRSLALDAVFERAPSRSNRYAVEPEFRSWVPQYLQRMLAQKFTVSARIIDAQGPVTIRRGDKSIKLTEVLAQSHELILRPGDIFETGPGGRLVLNDSDGQRTIPENSTAAVGGGDECLVIEGANSGRIKATHLIRGTLLWATTNTDVRGKCLISTPGFAVSVRGTEFSATSVPSETGNILTVTVSSGAVDVTDQQGATESIVAGQSRTLRATFPASATPRACAERARLTADIASLEQQVVEAGKLMNPLFEKTSQMGVGDLLD